MPVTGRDAGNPDLPGFVQRQGPADSVTRSTGAPQAHNRLSAPTAERECLPKPLATSIYIQANIAGLRELFQLDANSGRVDKQGFLRKAETFSWSSVLPEVVGGTHGAPSIMRWDGGDAMGYGIQAVTSHTIERSTVNRPCAILQHASPALS